MYPTLWLSASCLPKQYCAFPVQRPRCTFDVSLQVPLTFLETAPCSAVIGEQFAQMLTEGRSLACASQVDDSGPMPMRLQTMSGWTHNCKRQLSQLSEISTVWRYEGRSTPK